MSNKKQLAVTLRRVADIPRFTFVYEFSNVLQSLKNYGQYNQKKNLHMKKKIVSILRPRTEPSTFRSLPPTFVYYSNYFGGGKPKFAKFREILLFRSQSNKKYFKMNENVTSR